MKDLDCPFELSVQKKRTEPDTFKQYPVPSVQLDIDGDGYKILRAIRTDTNEQLDLDSPLAEYAIRAWQQYLIDSYKGAS